MDPTVPSPESSQIDIPPPPPTESGPSFPTGSPQVIPPETSSGPVPTAPNLVASPSAPIAPPPPDMNNVTGMPSPQGEKLNTKIIIWIVVGIILVILIGGGAYLLASGRLSGTGKTPTPTPALNPVVTPTPEASAGMEDWNTFEKEGVGFTFMYPPDLEYREYEDGTFSVSKTGPSQTEGTEFFDGISLGFKQAELGGLTIIEFVEQKAAELKEAFEATTPEVVQIAGGSGYKMHVKGLVEADYYYVALGTSSYLEIIDATMDPTNAGFAETVQKILSSLKIL